jgi:hypothetical protein
MAAAAAVLENWLIQEIYSSRKSIVIATISKINKMF